jgi:hypothetical protein
MICLQVNFDVAVKSRQAGRKGSAFGNCEAEKLNCGRADRRDSTENHHGRKKMKN